MKSKFDKELFFEGGALESLLSDLKAKVEDLDIANRQIVIWGRGYVSTLYANAFKYEEISIYGYTDNSAKNISEKFNEHTVISIEELEHLSNPLVIICVKNNKALAEIKKTISTIKNANLASLTMDELIIGKNADKLSEVMGLLVDEHSKAVYRELIRRKICSDMKMWDLYEDHQYFGLPEFMEDNSGEVFVDLGSYVGDTLEKFLLLKGASFKNYFAFEPDENNYRALCHRIERINREWNLNKDVIIPVFAGAGKESQQLNFEELGNHSSKFSNESTGVTREIKALDDYFSERKVTFIKADIESYELDMLQGAVKVLKRDRPKLAICIYHNATDMYSIIDWLNQLELGYKFYVRHHSVRDTETVLYAICK